MKIDPATGLEIIGECIEDPNARHFDNGIQSALSIRQKNAMRKHLNIVGERGLVTDHICNNSTCMNPDHVRAVTQSENLRAAYARGTKVPSDPNKYTDGFVRVMLILHLAVGRSPEYLYKQYGLNATTLSCWKRGHSRGHIVKDLIARGLVTV